MASVQPFFNWLLQTTLSGSVVIALILLAQKVFGRKLGSRWSHALWLVLLVRLMLPGTFHDQINLLSLVHLIDRLNKSSLPKLLTQVKFLKALRLLMPKRFPVKDKNLKSDQVIQQLQNLGC